MNFVAKLQQHYYELERNNKKLTQQIIDLPILDEKSDFSIEDLINFGSEEATQSSMETSQRTESQITPDDDPLASLLESNKNEEFKFSGGEEMIETSTQSSPKSLTEQIEFHKQLTSTLLKAMSNLVMNFTNIDKVKEYIVKTNFLEKSLIFISNRVERFPELMNTIYECQELKELFLYLFMS
jgi:hypothetical protein